MHTRIGAPRPSPLTHSANNIGNTILHGQGCRVIHFGRIPGSTGAPLMRYGINVSNKCWAFDANCEYLGSASGYP